MRRVYGQFRTELGKRVIIPVKGIHRPPLVTWEENIRDGVKEELRETRLRGETHPCVREPASAIAGEVVASGQVIVVQDRHPRREIKVRLKSRGQRVPEVKDTEVLTNVDIATRYVIRKKGAVLTWISGRLYGRDSDHYREVSEKLCNSETIRGSFV